MCFASFVCLGACVYVLEFCVKLVQTKNMHALVSLSVPGVGGTLGCHMIG